jgi:hypothetical protein
MKILVFVLAIVLSTFAQTPRTERDYLAELKELARKNNLYYVVFCTDWQNDPNFQFQAELCEADCRYQYVEEGGKRWWSGTGNTQQAAARDLIIHFVGAKEKFAHVAQHKNEVKHLCPPNIRGGPK